MIRPMVDHLRHGLDEEGLTERRRRHDDVDVTPAAPREEPPPVPIFRAHEYHVSREAFAQRDHRSHHQNLIDATRIPDTMKIGVAMLTRSFPRSIALILML